MFSLLAIPAIRRLLEGLLVLAALGAIVYALYDKGVHAGESKEASAEVGASKAQFDRIEETFQQQLAASADAVRQYQSLVGSLLEQASNAASQANAAAVAGAADKQKVASLVDSQLQKDLEAKLGGPLSRPDILRLDDTIVTDYPHETDQVTQLAAQVKALTAAGDVKDKQVAGTASERDSALAAYNGILPLYAQAYNAAIPARRKWYCLFLCVRKKTLNLPEPASLQPVAK